MKIEHDRVQILGGVLEGVTTGAPIALLIRNEDHSRWQGAEVAPMTKPRPGHADLTGAVKYGYRDLRPASERASARETAARVAAGAVCKHFLAQFGVRIGGYVVSIGDVAADLGDMSYEDRLAQAEDSPVRCPLDTADTAMQAAIEHATRAKDTLGGEIEVVALGVPIGLGSFMQWDARLDARLARAVMSVQAIKGVAIGDAFSNARLSPRRTAPDESRGRHRGRSLQRQSDRRARGDEADRDDARAAGDGRPRDRAGRRDGIRTLRFLPCPARRAHSRGHGRARAR